MLGLMLLSALNQVGIFKPLRIHASIPIISMLAGGLSVSFASLMAANVYNATVRHTPALAKAVQSGTVPSELRKILPAKQDVVDFMNRAKTQGKRWVIAATSGSIPALVNLARDYREEATYIASGLLVFSTFGGRMRNVLPSNIFKPGAYSRISASIPANGDKYATAIEKYGSARTGLPGLSHFGVRHGCHTCGRRGGGSFVGDHMPPNKFAKPGQLQRLYPQCSPCSSLQGGAVRSETPLYITHALRFRLYHLWVPLGPFAWAYLQ
jgi:hypothetical protein